MPPHGLDATLAALTAITFDPRAFLLFVLVITPLEHLFPIHDKARGFRRGWLTDAMHFFLSGIVIRFLLTAVIVAAAAAGAQVVPPAWSAWVAGLPLVVAVILAIVIADLGFYLAHRAMHSLPVLWRFHAVHHSSEEMDWLAAYRVHPVDQVLVKGASLVPLYLMGFSWQAIALASLIYHWQALFIHSNVRVPLGPFRFLVAGPEFHHWHHANERAAHDRNFAGQLSFWDVLFGTHHLPGRMPDRYGVDDPVPDGWAAQLAYPFLRPGADRPADGPTSSPPGSTPRPRDVPAE